MTPRAILFDLDGTLIDSHADLAHAVNAALREIGLPERSIAEIRGFIGEGSRRLLEQAIAPRQDLLEVAHAAWERAYAAGLLERTRLYPGIAGLLQAAAARWPGQLAIHTNKPGRFARPIVDGLGLAGVFRRVLGGGDGHARKPDPAGAQALLGELAVAPCEAIYVGDSRIDAQTAAAAGIPFLAVGWGYGTPSELRAEGVTRAARDAAELAVRLDLSPSTAPQA